jgi:hypothetical protein
MPTPTKVIPESDTIFQIANDVDREGIDEFYSSASLLLGANLTEVICTSSVPI